jgi:hypothetical protein
MHSQWVYRIVAMYAWRCNLGVMMWILDGVTHVTGLASIAFLSMRITRSGSALPYFPNNPFRYLFFKVAFTEIGISACQISNYFLPIMNGDKTKLEDG